MADYLFEGIIIDILHRLPVKTLLRCTAVSKSWYSLITSNEFISSHMKYAASSKKVAPSLLLRRCIKSSERYELYSDNESFTRFATLEFPFRSMNAFFTIVGSCNGLLCLSDDRVYFMNTIILWNPSIKKSVLLPKPNMIYSSYGSFIQCLGFGFDPVGNDYKVVRITYVDLPNKPQIEVYKLSSGVWQDMSFLELGCVVYNRSRQIYVNGASHWIARYLDLYDLIVSFDMSLEVFRTVMLPVHLASNDPSRSHDLMLYKGSLALTSWSVAGAEPCFCVYVMQEYRVEKSWTQKFRFDFSSIEEFVRPLWIREQGEVVGIWNDGRLYSHDEEGGEAKDLGVRGYRSDTYQRSLHVDSFVCSLVLLERGPYSSDVATGNNLQTLQTGDGDNVGSSGSEYENGSESISKHNVEVCCI